MMLFMIVLRNAQAWWDVGHMLVANIAESVLKNNNSQVYAKANQLIKAFQGLTDGRTNTFTEAAVWPDDVKATGFNAMDNFHFIDRVYDPDGLNIIMPQYNKDINAVNLVGWALRVLNHSSQVNFQRAFMLRYLLHMVGDIHQPLHAVAMYNKSCPITGDLGGNFWKIKNYNNEDYNLHEFLDSIASVIQKKNQTVPRPLDAAGFQYVSGLASKIMSDYPQNSFGNLTTSNDVGSWALQSYNLALEKIYPYIKVNNKASYEWTIQIYEMCRKQIALAGYRLANLIAQVVK